MSAKLAGRPPVTQGYPEVAPDYPIAATTTSSSSGSGGTAAVHAWPTAPALAPARGRVCASEYDARRVHHAHGARDRFGGTRWASGGSVERRIWDPVSCRRSLVGDNAQEGRQRELSNRGDQSVRRHCVPFLRLHRTRAVLPAWIWYSTYGQGVMRTRGWLHEYIVHDCAKTLP